MMSVANFISFIQVNSELEALLLEAQLIRKYTPHFNIQLKDDKHPLYIIITKEEFPRVITARKTDIYKGSILAAYGPFPSSLSVHTVLKMIRRIFPYSDHKIGKRGCLYSHIGLCDPCPSDIVSIKNLELKNLARKKYKKNIVNIKKILDGRIKSLERELEREMRILSEKEDFEKAAEVRNKINRLDYITRPQIPSDFYIENPNLYSDQRNLEIQEFKETLLKNGLKIRSLERIECFDIAHLSGSSAAASMVTFIKGEADKSFYRHFRIKIAKGGDDYNSMREVAKRRNPHSKDWGIPDIVVVDGGIGQVKAFSENFNLSPVVGIAKHPDRLVVGDNKIILKGNVLNLISRIRDEAHRFARRYHHNLIIKSLLNS